METSMVDEDDNIIVERLVNPTINHLTSIIVFYIVFIFVVPILMVNSYIESTFIQIVIYSISIAVVLSLAYIVLNHPKLLSVDYLERGDKMDFLRNVTYSFVITDEGIYTYNIEPLAPWILPGDKWKQDVSIEKENIKNYETGFSILPGYCRFLIIGEDIATVIHTKEKDKVSSQLDSFLSERVLKEL